MKYTIFAKFLGAYLPEEKTNINDCTIEKNSWLIDIAEDVSIDSLRDKSMEQHLLERKVKNFVFYPQGTKPTSNRIIESEYSISTKVDVFDIRDAVQEANRRFDEVTVAFSLAVKMEIVPLGEKTVKKYSDSYDFEISAAFVEVNGEEIQVKLPRPLLNGHNYFPKLFPQGFLERTQSILAVNKKNDIFNKSLSYFSLALKQFDSGNYSKLEILMNFTKCLELVCSAVPVQKVTVQEITKCCGRPKPKRDPHQKEIFEQVGNKIGVPSDCIKYAQQAWDIRSKHDIAHAHPNKNIFNIMDYRHFSGTVAEYIFRFSQSEFCINDRNL